MPKAIWNGVVLAESGDTLVIEGNHYFPPHALRPEFFRVSATTTTCPWKGEAHYYNVQVDGKTIPDAAWYYPNPKPEAQHLEGRVAFGKGVRVEV
jgi:uncharacterized protein (DUF427 family)